MKKGNPLTLTFPHPIATPEERENIIEACRATWSLNMQGLSIDGVIDRLPDVEGLESAPLCFVIPPYSEREREAAERLRSRANVARAALRARTRAKMSQATLAKEAKTKQARISQIEGLKGNPRFNTVAKVARALGMMVTLVRRPTPEGGPE